MAERAPRWDDRRPAVEHPRPDQEDMLNPTRALRTSLGESRSQRVGDSSPLANPDVSFPGELDDDPAED